MVNNNNNNNNNNNTLCKVVNQSIIQEKYCESYRYIKIL